MHLGRFAVFRFSVFRSCVFVCVRAILGYSRALMSTASAPG